tara:strand:- start:1174 stop:1425 length:252 start_codon:yes stop_codon:yes gene_type:complete
MTNPKLIVEINIRHNGIYSDLTTCIDAFNWGRGANGFLSCDASDSPMISHIVDGCEGFIISHAEDFPGADMVVEVTPVDLDED